MTKKKAIQQAIERVDKATAEMVTRLRKAKGIKQKAPIEAAISTLTNVKIMLEQLIHSEREQIKDAWHDSREPEAPYNGTGRDYYTQNYGEAK